LYRECVLVGSERLVSCAGCGRQPEGERLRGRCEGSQPGRQPVKRTQERTDWSMGGQLWWRFRQFQNSSSVSTMKAAARIARLFLLTLCFVCAAFPQNAAQMIASIEAAQAPDYQGLDYFSTAFLSIPLGKPC